MEESPNWARAHDHDVLAVADYVKVDAPTLQKYIRKGYEKYPVAWHDWNWKANFNIKLNTLQFGEQKMAHFSKSKYKILIAVWWILAILGLVGGILIELYYHITIPFLNGSFDLGLVAIVFGISMAIMALMLLGIGRE